MQHKFMKRDSVTICSDYNFQLQYGKLGDTAVYLSHFNDTCFLKIFKISNNT